jgi:hypothetical protein
MAAEEALNQAKYEHAMKLYQLSKVNILPAGYSLSTTYEIFIKTQFITSI